MTTPTFPVALISTGSSRFLRAIGEERDGYTFRLWQYLFQPLNKSLVIDSTGQAFELTDPRLIGINWRIIFMSGPIVGLFATVISLIFISIPVRVTFKHSPTLPMELREFKSAVLARMPSNFMGRGGRTEWQAPVNTSKSFAQLVRRLCLYRDAA